MTEKQLVEAFEQYKGHKLKDYDILGHIEFNAFCAGYKLKEEEL